VEPSYFTVGVFHIFLTPLNTCTFEYSFSDTAQIREFLAWEFSKYPCS